MIKLSLKNFILASTGIGLLIAFAMTFLGTELMPVDFIVLMSYPIIASSNIIQSDKRETLYRYLSYLTIPLLPLTLSFFLGANNYDKGQALGYVFTFIYVPFFATTFIVGVIFAIMSWTRKDHSFKLWYLLLPGLVAFLHFIMMIFASMVNGPLN